MSLGASNRDLSFQNNELILNYNQGELCKDKLANRQTRIIFECDRNAGNGWPSFEFELDNCVYVFVWKTVYACLPEVINRGKSISNV